MVFFKRRQLARKREIERIAQAMQVRRLREIRKQIEKNETSDLPLDAINSRQRARELLESIDLLKKRKLSVFAFLRGKKTRHNANKTAHDVRFRKAYRTHLLKELAELESLSKRLQRQKAKAKP